MTRRRLVALLEAFVPADLKEAGDRAAMRDFAERLGDPFARDQPEAHFTASAVVLDEDGCRVCLVHHRKLKRWLQPGGHFEPGDGGDVVRAALREAREETGCEVELQPGVPAPFDLDIHEIPALGAEPPHLHLDLRLLVRARASDALAHCAAESLGARWLSWDEALVQAGDASLARALRKARAWSRGP